MVSTSESQTATTKTLRFPGLFGLLLISNDSDKRRVLVVAVWDSDVDTILLSQLDNCSTLLANNLRVELRININSDLEALQFPISVFTMQSLNILQNGVTGSLHTSFRSMDGDYVTLLVGWRHADLNLVFFHHFTNHFPTLTNDLGVELEGHLNF